MALTQGGTVWSNSDPGAADAQTIAATGVSGTGLFLVLVGSCGGGGQAISTIAGNNVGGLTQSILNNTNAGTFSVAIFTYTGTLTNETITATWANTFTSVKVISVFLVTGYLGTVNAVTGADGEGAWSTDSDIPAGVWSTGWTAGSFVYGVMCPLGSATGAAEANTTSYITQSNGTDRCAGIFRLTAVTTTTEEDFGYAGTGFAGTTGAAIEVLAGSETVFSQVRLRSGS